jgi:hypothetical protein
MSESENARRNAGTTHAAAAATLGNAASAARRNGGAVIELFKHPGSKPRPRPFGNPAYLRGVADGAALRAHGAPISPYLSVGIDDYASGFRAGYYGR